MLDHTCIWATKAFSCAHLCHLPSPFQQMWSSPGQGLSLLNIIILAAIYIHQKKPQRKEKARWYTHTHARTHFGEYKGKEIKTVLGHRVCRARGLQGARQTEKICCKIQDIHCSAVALTFWWSKGSLMSAWSGRARSHWWCWLVSVAWTTNKCFFF